MVTRQSSSPDGDPESSSDADWIPDGGGGRGRDGGGRDGGGEMVGLGTRMRIGGRNMCGVRWMCGWYGSNISWDSC